MGIYSFLVVCFYTFLGLFLGNRTAEITLTSIFSFMVIYLFIALVFLICHILYTSFFLKKNGKKKVLNMRLNTRSVDWSYKQSTHDNQISLNINPKIQNKTQGNEFIYFWIRKDLLTRDTSCAKPIKGTPFGSIQCNENWLKPIQSTI